MTYNRNCNSVPCFLTNVKNIYINKKLILYKNNNQVLSKVHLNNDEARKNSSAHQRPSCLLTLNIVIERLVPTAYVAIGRIYLDLSFLSIGTWFLCNRVICKQKLNFLPSYTFLSIWDINSLKLEYFYANAKRTLSDWQHDVHIFTFKAGRFCSFSDNQPQPA